MQLSRRDFFLGGASLYAMFAVSPNLAKAASHGQSAPSHDTYLLNGFYAQDVPFKNLLLMGNTIFNAGANLDANGFPKDNTFTSGNVTCNFPGNYYGKYRMWWTGNMKAQVSLPITVYAGNANWIAPAFFNGTLPGGGYVEFDFSMAITGVATDPLGSGQIQITTAGANGITPPTVRIQGVQGTNGLAAACNGDWVMTEQPGAGKWLLIGSTFPAGAVWTNATGTFRFSPANETYGFLNSVSYTGFNAIALCMSGVTPDGIDHSGDLADVQTGLLSKMFNQSFVRAYSSIKPSACRFLDVSGINYSNWSSNKYAPPAPSGPDNLGKMAYQSNFQFPAGAWVNSITDGSPSTGSAFTCSAAPDTPAAWTDGETFQGIFGSAPRAIGIVAAAAGATAFQCTGSISGSVLTVTAILSGAIPGSSSVVAPVITGTNVAANTQITGQISGTPGGVGTYNVSPGSQTVASTTITGNLIRLTVNDTSILSAGQNAIVGAYNGGNQFQNGDGIWALNIIDSTHVDLASNPKSSLTSLFQNSFTAVTATTFTGNAIQCNTAGMFGGTTYVVLSMAPGGTMPTGLLQNKIYVVFSGAGGNLELADPATPNTQITFTGGSGTMSVCMSWISVATINCGARGAKLLVGPAITVPLPGNFNLITTGRTTCTYNSITDTVQVFAAGASDAGLLARWPIEVKVALCNKLGVHYWHQFPHLYDTASALAEASYIAQNLNYKLACHFEFSNEPWNSGFSQYRYSYLAGCSYSNLSAGYTSFDGPSWLGLRNRQIFGGITNIFAARGNLRRTIQWQGVNLASAVKLHLFEGSELNGTSYPLYAAAGNPNYDGSGGTLRPIDVTEYLSFAPYWNGAILGPQGLESRANAADIAAFQAACDSPGTAASYTWFDNDLKQGTFNTQTCTFTGSPTTVTVPNLNNYNTSGGGAPTDIVFTVSAGGTFPTGLSPNTDYIAINVNAGAKTFQVATPTAPSTPISFSGGSGTLSVGILGQGTLLYLKNYYYPVWAAAATSYGKGLACYEGGCQNGYGGTQTQVTGAGLASSYGGSVNGLYNQYPSGIGTSGTLGLGISKSYFAAVSYRRSSNYAAVWSQFLSDMKSAFANVIPAVYTANGNGDNLYPGPNYAWALMDTDINGQPAPYYTGAGSPPIFNAAATALQGL